MYVRQAKEVFCGVNKYSASDVKESFILANETATKSKEMLILVVNDVQQYATIFDLFIYS